MDFDKVAYCFEQIEKVSSRLEITSLLALLLSDATPEEASIIANLSLGQLNPPYQGTKFNIAIKNVIKAIAVAQNVPTKDIEDQAKLVGDVGLVVAASMQKACNDQMPVYAGVSVQEIYDALRSIEQVGGTGSQEEKITQLVTLIKRLTPQSAKYVLRIILGTLRLGFSDMTLIDALSWMCVGDKSLRTRIEDAYNICADLGFIAALLKKEGIATLDKMVIRTGIPIRPASAERLPTARAIIEKIGAAVAQPKLDGLRVQIHINKAGLTPEIHFFSRNLQDISYMFPDLIPALLDLDVETLITEGEVICFDQHTGSFLPFQETAKRKRKHGIEQAIADFPLKLFMFDILYRDGRSLLAKTHTQRRQELLEVCPIRVPDIFQEAVKEDPDKVAFEIVHKITHEIVQVVDEVPVRTGKELEDYFLAMIASGLEGVVVKRPDAPYQPGKRNFNWIKLKRQEVGHLEDTIDCVILGYYAGSGKRAQFGIGAFLVGVFNPGIDAFQTVAKIGTGLKDAGWRELKQKSDQLISPEKPRNVVCAKDLFPDVWVWPEMVCLVRADEITLSPVHTAGKTEDHLGYALRFPRIMGYRYDKSAKEATDVEEIKRLYEDQFI